MKKRILAVMLACFMIVSLLPMSAFAEEIKCPGEGTHTAENCDNELVREVPATCDGWGYNVYRCLGCDELFADDITEKKGEHVMETIEAVAPVCDPDPEKMTNGVVGGEICSICGWFDATVYEVAPGTEIVAEHNYVAEEGATCVTGVTFNCTNCEATYTTEGGEHVWAELPIIGLDPNEDLLEDGWAIYQCVLCEEYSKKIPVLHHECTKYLDIVPGTDATCTETGIMYHYACRICDRTYIVEDGEFVEADVVTPALGHTYETLIEENGCEKTFECIRCEEVVTETIHDLQVKHIQAPTCVKVGWIVYACNYCDYIEYEYTPALGHTEAEEPVVIKEATCTEKGAEAYFCETCGTVLRTVETDALGHDYVAEITVPGTCVTKEVVTYTCSRCGDSYEVVGTTNNQHNPEDMNKGIVNEPTCTEDGNRIFYCTWCNRRIAETLPATGHELTWTETHYDCADGTGDAYIETRVYCDICGIIEEERVYVEREYLVIYEGGSYEENWKAAGHDHKYGNAIDYNEAMEALGYEDFEQFYSNNIQYVDTLRPATCVLDGLHKYQCTWCGEYMIIVEPAHGHVQEEVLDLPFGEYKSYPCAVSVYYPDYNLTINSLSGVIQGLGGTVIVTAVGNEESKDATCTEDGFTGSYTCLICGEKTEGDVIPALGHDFDELIDAREETCAADGSKAGGHCERCDKWFEITVEDDETVYTEIESAEDLVIDEFEHTVVVIDAWMPEYYDLARDPGFIYSHVGCAFCGEEYIVNFHRHHFVLNAELSTAPTCTEFGTDVYVCSCGFSYEEPVQPLGHRDENGNLLEDICANKGEICAVCEAEMTAEHTFGDWAHVDATCQNGEYNIRVCQICGADEVDPIDETLGDHVWGEPQPIFDENGYDTGKYIVGCVVCGHVEIKTAGAAVEYTANVENEILIVGSEMAVTITLSGNTADVWGFDIDVNYDNEALKFLRAEFGANFTGLYNDNETFVSVAANADGSAVVTEEIIVTLYFEVIDVIDGEITIDHNMTTDPELNKIDATTVGAEYDISLLMDYNNDGVIDLLDVQGVYNYIAGTEGFNYSILGDVDMDGDMDLDDLVAIYEYIVG